MEIRNVEMCKKEIGNTGSKRFSQGKFKALLAALINDKEFAAKYVKPSKDEYGNPTFIEKEFVTSKEFRKFLRKVLEMGGIDRCESGIVDNFEFSAGDMEGLYEFFSTAIYEYMDSGNRFDLLPKEDFNGALSLKENAGGTKVQRAVSPQDRSKVLEYEVTKKPYKSLKVKSSCPPWLVSRIKK